MPKQANNPRPQPRFMHPAIFLSGWVLLGTMFAIQDWMSMRVWTHLVNLRLLIEAWGMQYFIWASFAGWAGFGWGDTSNGRSWFPFCCGSFR